MITCVAMEFTGNMPLQVHIECITLKEMTVPPTHTHMWPKKCRKTFSPFNLMLLMEWKVYFSIFIFFSAPKRIIWSYIQFQFFNVTSLLSQFSPAKTKQKKNVKIRDSTGIILEKVFWLGQRHGANFHKNAITSFISK